MARPLKGPGASVDRSLRGNNEGSWRFLMGSLTLFYSHLRPMFEESRIVYADLLDRCRTLGDKQPLADGLVGPGGVACF